MTSANLQGKELLLHEPDPWLDPVDGAELLDELVAAFARHVVLPPGGPVACALWVLHSHTLDASSVSPILVASSAEMRSGKSTLLDLLAALTPRALVASNISPSAVFRAVEKYGPTLLVDEGDTFLRDNEELRGLLNSGHTRRRSAVVRTVGTQFEPRVFSTWGAKAIALIGRLPATLEDRAIVLRMRRRAPREKVEPLRRDRMEIFDSLLRRAVRWGADNLDALRGANPAVPAELNDRASDNWRPLLAIADQVGGEWPERARQTARAISRPDQEAESSAGIQLLSDLRDLFAVRRVERLPSVEIAGALSAMEDRPWAEWRQGKPITPVQLARLLKAHEICPRTVRSGDETFKGYELSWFQDAFIRYLPCKPSHPSQAAADAPEKDGGSSHLTVSVTDTRPHDNPHGYPAVTSVTPAASKGGKAARRTSRTRRAAPGNRSLFELTDDQMALLDAFGWERLDAGPEEGAGDD